jgi:hypothetical protein
MFTAAECRAKALEKIMQAKSKTIATAESLYRLLKLGCFWPKGSIN